MAMEKVKIFLPGSTRGMVQVVEGVLLTPEAYLRRDSLVIFDVSDDGHSNEKELSLEAAFGLLHPPDVTARKLIQGMDKSWTGPAGSRGQSKQSK